MRGAAEGFLDPILEPFISTHAAFLFKLAVAKGIRSPSRVAVLLFCMAASGLACPVQTSEGRHCWLYWEDGGHQRNGRTVVMPRWAFKDILNVCRTRVLWVFAGQCWTATGRNPMLEAKVMRGHWLKP